MRAPTSATGRHRACRSAASSRPASWDQPCWPGRRPGPARTATARAATAIGRRAARTCSLRQELQRRDHRQADRLVAGAVVQGQAHQAGVAGAPPPPAVLLPGPDGPPCPPFGAGAPDDVGSEIEPVQPTAATANSRTARAAKRGRQTTMRDLLRGNDGTYLK